MNHSRMHNARPSLVVLAIVLLGAFLVIPSSATAEDQHGGHNGIQRFTFLGTDPTDQDTPNTVVANGPIHAKGTVTTLSDTEDVLTFPQGTVTITHEAKTSNDSFDPVTCLFRFSERGTYKVTGGTGAYDDASGRGNYRVKGLGVGCDENAPPEVFMIRIFAKGPIHF
jgi:hypothetical protein